MFVWFLIFLFLHNMTDYLKLYYYEFACIFSELPIVRKATQGQLGLFTDVSTKPRILCGRYMANPKEIFLELNRMNESPIYR